MDGGEISADFVGVVLAVAVDGRRRRAPTSSTRQASPRWRRRTPRRRVRRASSCLRGRERRRRRHTCSRDESCPRWRPRCRLSSLGLRSNKGNPGAALGQRDGHATPLEATPQVRQHASRRISSLLDNRSLGGRFRSIIVGDVHSGYSPYKLFSNRRSLPRHPGGGHVSFLPRRCPAAKRPGSAFLRRAASGLATPP